MNRWHHTLITGLLTVACLAFLSLGTGHAQEPESVGDVADLLGLAEAERETPDPIELAVQDDVFRTDRLRTFEDSHLTVALDDGSWFKMDADSEADIADYVAGQTALLNLARGRARVFVSKTVSRYNNSFRVQTDDAVIGVQGTFFIVTKLAGETTVYVVQGSVSVTSTDPAYPQPVIAEAGEFVRVEANSPPSEPVAIEDVEQIPKPADIYNWGSFAGKLPPDFVVPVPVPAPSGAPPAPSPSGVDPAPEPTASAPSCICPKPGPWNVQNHTGEMVCVGAVSMAMPLAPNSTRGTIEIQDNCATIVGSGLSEDEATIEMHRTKDCDYEGSVGGSQDGIPMTINFTMEIQSEEHITGDLKSTVTEQGMTCNMSRTFELHFGQ